MKYTIIYLSIYNTYIVQVIGICNIIAFKESHSIIIINVYIICKIMTY